VRNNSYNSYLREFRKNPKIFWEKVANFFIWDEYFEEIYGEIKKGPRKWFAGGRIDYGENILDSKVRAGLKNKEILVIRKEGNREKRYTYGLLLEEVKRLCFLLQKKGVARGKNTLILLSNEDKELSILLSLALQRLGVLFGFLYAGFTEQAITYYLTKTKAKFLIYDKNIIASFKGFTGLNPIEKRELKQVMTGRAPSGSISFKSSEPRFFVFTSGTTSLPKIIVTGNIGFLLSIFLFEKLLLGLNKDSSILITLHFAFGPTIALYYSALFLESKIVVCEKKDFLSTSEFNKVINEEGVNSLAMAPPFLDKIFHRVPASLRIAFTGEKIDRLRWTRCRRFFPNSSIINVYGLAETMACFSSPPVNIRTGSFDKVNLLKQFPGVQYKIAGKDKTGIGKLLIKNILPSLCSGYYGDRKTFLNRFTGHFLFFDTKDLARERKGFVEIVGRTDTLKKIKGRFLEPGIVEEEVSRVDGIKGTKVLCLRSRVYLFVLGKKSRALEKEIKKKIRKKVGSYAVPAGIYFLKVFPRSQTGKISERLLWRIARDISA